MSIDFGSWLTQNSPSIVASQEALRAQVEWARIQDKPTTVSLLRYGSIQPAQTVRLEWDNSQLNADSEAGVAILRRGVLFGIKNHPTLPDLDIAEMDTFVVHDNEYTITSINYHLIGQIQATFEAV